MWEIDHLLLCKVSSSKLKLGFQGDDIYSNFDLGL